MKPYRVLVVEDHPFQHEYLLNVFSEVGGFKVDTVWDGDEALEHLARHNYDLLLTDLLMPVMDGVQLIQKIAALKKRPALALMSASSRRMLISAGLVAKNLGISVVGLISKPVELNAVMRLKEQMAAYCLNGLTDPALTIEVDPFSIVRAMDNAEIQAWFQPKKSLLNGNILSAEALVRWVHPEAGTLLPKDFLSLLIKQGLEERLLWLMMEQTLQAQRKWRDQGWDIPVSINLPTHLLDNHQLADRLRDYVVAEGGEPRSIVFELMESSTTKELSNYYAGACRLRMMGFGLAQDDFGQGFSSYFNLVSTPFSELKIDRSLVHGCVENENLASALRSLVELSRKLGLTVVAEGVETQAELAFLRRIGCDQAQGFLICGAVSPADFGTLLLEDSSKPSWG
ncbi:EAL domain-containing protein [Pseudomonas sp. FSL R10-1350]|uniref:EAL domain-containing protein n=2 Tax=Pseudomonas TaxID=286 RepID=A0A0J6IFY0_9PSED|nr:EAL domain-containing protein [Pseudomonas helleri]MQT60291.1 EAL domain-containing protein [Pseudomonas sp. FSL R10-0399]MQU64248.1 EAL domain-containing protein [Pseudomonas sp. FSL R10-1350]KMN10619.1 diguanylate phosphodiesterase [Pseudomonas helleri]MQT30631.1 EAL domain-containing protein [Pseudomonas helleri]MQT47583.1 EAL domain-containing protein [Pseudomonas helleri]